MTEYLTTADALFFHKELIARHGGTPGIRDLGALEASLHRAQTGYYGTLIQEAAALFESLLHTRPFIDGNRRVAFAVVDVFLRINGYRIEADSQSTDSVMLDFFARKVFDMSHLLPRLQSLVKAGAAGPPASTP
ncbi:MAG: type II toxin-antitoxin system death-on-curing family toxin [Steroidobacteraceae bacterium]